MMASGIVLENVNNLLGKPFTSVFFIFWTLSNIATGLYPIQLLSNFYKWGLAWPLRHDIIGARTLLFGTKNVLGQNFGVLLAWVVVSIALQPFTIWVQLRRKRGEVGAHKREVWRRFMGRRSNEGSA
jgi:hypothetical protein